MPPAHRGSDPWAVFADRSLRPKRTSDRSRIGGPFGQLVSGVPWLAAVGVGTPVSPAVSGITRACGHVRSDTGATTDDVQSMRGARP